VRKTALALAAAAALAGGGCSSITTSVDYDPGTTFATYKTYAFKDVFDRDAFEMKRVRAALDRTLAAKGLTKTDPKADAKPDLWVVLHVKTHNDKVITTWGTGWGVRILNELVEEHYED